MTSQEEINQQQGLLNVHRGTLSILLRQRAQFTGPYTPPSIEHGILEARANIRRVKKILRGLGILVADLPDDEDDSSSSSSQIQTPSSNATMSPPSTTPISKSPPQTNQKRIRQRDMAWWAGIASIVVLVIVLGLGLSLALLKLINQPSLPVPTESSSSASIQTPLSAISSTHSPVSSPELIMPIKSVEPIDMSRSSAQCPSDDYEFVAQIPPQPSGPDDVQFGEGLVAMLHDSFLYVAHTTQVPTIQKLTTSGKVAVDWKVRSGIGEGEFGYAQAVAVSSDGSVYVADGVQNRIQKLDMSSNTFRVWADGSSGAGNFNDPRSIAIDSHGNVYIADTGNNRIVKFSSDGKFQNSWGSAGSSKGQFAQPWGISVDTKENVVYVADTENNRIQKFDNEGNYQGEWGARGTGDGQFMQPRGVSVDTQGNVYVADSSNHRILKFTSTGTCLAKWGDTSKEGNGTGQFKSPQTVSVGTDSLIYVADSGNKRIQIFRPRQ